MQEYLSKIIKERETRLAIIQVPTGYGKTFEVTRKMMEMAKDPNETRKIIYLTTLNKNLPEDELLKHFNGNQKEYDKCVLRIRANLDEVEEKLENLEIPEEFKGEFYYKLIKEGKKHSRSYFR